MAIDARASNIAIRPLTERETQDGQIVHCVSDIINTSYTQAEVGLWKPGTTRTDDSVILDWHRKGEVFVAIDEALEGSDAVLGVVHVEQHADGLYEFGPLAVKTTSRKSGTGRRLVQHAETHAIRQGARKIGCRILVPRRPQTHAGKAHLQAWYEKLGYRQVDRQGVPEKLVHRYMVPADFTELRKDLV